MLVPVTHLFALHRCHLERAGGLAATAVGVCAAEEVVDVRHKSLGTLVDRVRLHMEQAQVFCERQPLLKVHEG